jgi:DNA-binding LacI/PurR family transcriptional regulator
LPTIRDIAKRAGVSVGTVSNYLNNPELLADNTRREIQQAIEALGYFPSAAARSLKSRSTSRIGMVPLISPEDNRSMEPSDITFLDFLSAVNTTAAENGFALLLSTAISETDELPMYKRMVGERQIDGLILTGVRSHDPRVDFLLGQEFPFVAYGRTRSAEHPYVDVDGADGMRQAVDHLVALGHERIAYISPPPGLMCNEQRWEGFAAAMQSHSLPIDPNLVVDGDFLERTGQIAMHLFLDLPQPPTAVIASNDICAFGILTALQKRGLVGGRDVSVVGFDDSRMAARWTPSLTTVAQPFREIGFLVTKMLIEMIGGEPQDTQRVLKPRLIERESTSALKGP